MPVRTLMTAEQFDALPEEECREWELLDGELIEVSSATPKHNRILARLLRLLHNFPAQPAWVPFSPNATGPFRPSPRLRPERGSSSADPWRPGDGVGLPW